MKKLPLTAAMLSIFFSAGAARALDLQKSMPPQQWIEQLVPEDLPPLDYPSYYNDLDKAKAQVAAGRYRLALVTLNGAKGVDPIESAVVKAKALAAVGRSQEAIAALSTSPVRDDPGAQVLHAKILMSLGQYDEAIALLKKHLGANADSIAGHYQLGQAYELKGDLISALKAYTWFVQDQQLLEKWRGQTGEPIFDDPDSVTTIGRAIDRWATLTNAFKDNPDLHNLLLNMFVKVYDVIDRTYEPAHVAVAQYYLDHDDAKDALQELHVATNENPNDVSALLVLGSIAVDQFNFDQLDQIVNTLRSINPHSPEADLLEARNLMLQQVPEKAIAPIQRVLKTQPDNLEALGLLSGAYALMLEDGNSADVLKRVEKIDPDNATAYFEVAQQLASMRQYPRAEKDFKIAIARAPWWTKPRNALGLLYTQSGDENAARTTLDAAHTLDPFNMQTTNYLRLLDELAKFAKSETAHFIVYYDAQSDPVIPEYFGKYLESIYPDVCAAFNEYPPVKTLIEVFPTHDTFSVRTTGSPWIGTVGACTGRVIALVSPRKGKLTMGTFNWSSVLRHEFTHTVTLAATDNRISHWMTEGLAVEEEGQPIPWDWVPMLYDAVTKKKLFPIDELTWGFVRPRRPIDRQLAYAQSYWICKYIEQKYGHPAILKMLQCYKNGDDQAKVFQNSLGIDSAHFTSDFFAWCDQQVASWGYDPVTSKKVDALKEQGEALLAQNAYEKALPIWLEVNKLRPMDQLPHMRLASIYLALHRTDDAAKHLDALQAVELKDNRYAKGIARIYRNDGKLDQAVRYATRAVYIDPYDDAAHELLASLLAKTGDTAGLAREKHVLDILHEWHQLQQLQEQNPSETQ